MDEGGLWKLFFATGLPEAYLALAQFRAEREEETLARSAFGEERRQELI